MHTELYMFSAEPLAPYGTRTHPQDLVSAPVGLLQLRGCRSLPKTSALRLCVGARRLSLLQPRFLLARSSSSAMPPTQSPPALEDEQIQRLMVSEDALPALVAQLPPVAANCTRLYLCRHGQTDYNLQRKLQGRGVDMPLNAAGILQANYLARSLRDVPLRGIYCSSLRRARDTATVVAQAHPKLEVQPLDEVQEMSFGQLEGNALDVLEDKLHDIFRQWESGDFTARFPGGENPLDVVARGFGKIDAIVRASAPKDEVLFVTHGRFNKIVLAQMLHGALTHMQEIKQENTCVNVVDFDHTAQEYRPVALNNISHLPQSFASLPI